MHLGGNAGDLARKNTTGIGREFGKNLWILVANLLERKVEALGGHRLVVLPEINAALNGLWFGHGIKRLGIQRLAKLAVQGATFQERIILFLLQTARSVQALLVTSAGVA